MDAGAARQWLEVAQVVLTGLGVLLMSAVLYGMRLGGAQVRTGAEQESAALAEIRRRLDNGGQRMSDLADEVQPLVTLPKEVDDLWKRFGTAEQRHRADIDRLLAEVGMLRTETALNARELQHAKDNLGRIERHLDKER